MFGIGFRIVLFFMGIGMKLMYFGAELFDKDFQQRLKERDITIVIRCKKGRPARTFYLDKGRVYSKGKNHPDPDIAIIWKKPRHAAFAVLHVTPKGFVKSFTKCIMKDKLNIEFKMEPFVWASVTFAQMLGAYTNWDRRSKTYA